MSFVVQVDQQYLRAIPVQEPPIKAALELGPFDIAGRPMTVQIAAVAGKSCGSVEVRLEAVVVDGQGGRWRPVVGLSEPR